jgi:hypothetical protein
MSTQRTEIREAIVAILTNGDADPYPTLAGRNVFDSKSDDISNNSHDSSFPIITVFTDTSVGAPSDTANSWPMEWQAEVLIEISMAADRVSVSTNKELERRLDILEEQVLDMLFERQNETGTVNEAAISFSKMYSKLLRIASFRMSNTEHQHRIAMRGIQIDLTYNSKCKSAAAALPQLKTIGMAFDSGSGAPAVAKLNTTA